MIEVSIPGRGNYGLEHLLLDLNGTLTLGGEIEEGVPARVELLRDRIDITIVTADTRGRGQELGEKLRVKIHKVQPGEEGVQKLRLLRELGSQTTACIGNGSNDAYMLKESIVGICVLGGEGASAEALASCDLVAPDINSALDLLLNPERLVATLRR